MRFLKNSRWRGLLPPLCGVVLMALAGCATVSVNTVLDSQLLKLLGTLDFEVLRVRVINQTGATSLDLDLKVDGISQTINCTALVAICDITLPACPKRIEAVQERLLDAQGRFVGGLDFNGGDEFVFPEGEFDCGSIIVFKFGDREASAFAL